MEQPSEASSSADGTFTEDKEDSCSGGLEVYLLLHNIAKRANIGNIVRSAVAFGVKEIILYGSTQTSMYGSHVPRNAFRLRHFANLSEAIAYLKAPPRNCWICGVEIDSRAEPVHTHPFRGNTCFVLGNEGQGLDEKQMEACDHFVYISQYGNGTASLNVNVAGSIILHHFGVWSKKTEAARDGHKYILTTETSKDQYEKLAGEELAEVLAVREARKCKAAEDPDAGLVLGGIGELLDAADGVNDDASQNGPQ